MCPPLDQLVKLTTKRFQYISNWLIFWLLGILWLSLEASLTFVIMRAGPSLKRDLPFTSLHTSWRNADGDGGWRCMSNHSGNCENPQHCIQGMFQRFVLRMFKSISLFLLHTSQTPFSNPPPPRNTQAQTYMMGRCQKEFICLFFIV